MCRFLMLIVSLSMSIFSQSPYTISGFGKDARAFTPSDNKIIQPLSGAGSLTEVKSFPSLKPGEIVLRVRYSATDYRLYQGTLANTAFDPDQNLFSFELPSGISGEKASVAKFYKQKVDNPDIDEAKLYFDNNRIYAQFLPRLFYNDGGWKTIDAVNLSKDEKNARSVGNLQVLSVPDHAEIFIDGKSTGFFTPNYVQDIFEGPHTLKLQLKNYQSIDTSVDIKAGGIVKADFQLKSALGSLTLTSTPSGATVKINGVKSGTTPLTLNDLDPGVFNIEIEKELYKSASNKLTVEMNGAAKWNAVLESDFGTINIPSVPQEVTVLIDSKQCGTGPVNLNPGKHLVQLNGAGLYASVDTSVNIIKGRTSRVDISMKRLTGSITVMPIPMDAEIIINDKSYGTGSQVIEDLPTGNYMVICRKSGYEDGKQSVMVKAGATENVRFTLAEKHLNVEPISQISANNSSLENARQPAERENVKSNEAPEGYVWIPGGTFMMGSNNGSGDEKPVYQVTINGFYMSKTEVTQQEYERVMGKNPSSFKGCPTCPVEKVTWNKAKEYCEKVGGRLPTEAEWEYACRAGSTTKYYWGDEMDGDYAWYDKNSDRKTHPVARKKPNAFGLYDMSGNVWEWCSNWYDKNSPPQEPSTRELRVLRGGSWYENVDHLRSAFRPRYEPVNRSDDIGFRCVRSR